MVLVNETLKESIRSMWWICLMLNAYYIVIQMYNFQFQSLFGIIYIRMTNFPSSKSGVDEPIGN